MDMTRPISTIAQDSFEDLLAGRTGFPMADEQIPELLRSVIKSGHIVLLTDPDGKPSYTLSLSDDGKFRTTPCT